MSGKYILTRHYSTVTWTSCHKKSVLKDTKLLQVQDGKKLIGLPEEFHLHVIPVKQMIFMSNVSRFSSGIKIFKEKFFFAKCLHNLTSKMQRNDMFSLL